MSVFDRHKNGAAPPDDIETQGAEMRAARRRIEAALADLSPARAFDEYRRAARAGRIAVADLDGDWIYPLAHYAAEERQSDEALQLLNGFSQRHSHHEDVVKNYVLAAEIMQRDFGQGADALQLLQRLEQQYAGHPDEALIRDLQRRLEAE